MVSRDSWKSARRRRLYSKRIGDSSRRRRRRLSPVLLFLAGSGLLCISLILWLLSNSSDNTTSTVTTSSLRYRNIQQSDEHALVDDPSAPPLIHIVHTRFMQEQGKLTTLAQARLHLFYTFCLPTMIHQTSSDFIWIIKTDPTLDRGIREELVRVLDGAYPHIFLVGSLRNFQAGEEEGSWRGGQEGHELLYQHPSTPIYTGDRSLLQRAYDLRRVVPVLETRLDADDGLHVSFVETVQKQALHDFSRRQQQQHEKKWMYWCVKQHVEWYAGMHDQHEGILNPVQHEKLCITPGLTVGYNVGTNQVPQYAHDVLFKSVLKEGGCTDDSNDKHDCIRMMDESSFLAIRSRTPTSAGMMDVLWEHSKIPPHQGSYWSMLKKFFYIIKQDVDETNTYIQSNLVDIAKENLQGQCTKGHSCKQSSVEILQKLMQSYGIDNET